MNRRSQKEKKKGRERKSKKIQLCIYHIKPVCMVHQLMTAKRNCGYVDRFVIRWYASGSSECYFLEYLESLPGGPGRRIRWGSSVATIATIAAAAAADIRADAHRSSVAHHLGQGRSSACRVLAWQHRRPVALLRGDRDRRVAHPRRRRRRWRSKRWWRRRTDDGEEDRRQVVCGATVPVLRLLPG